jgi:dCTP deaminase
MILSDYDIKGLLSSKRLKIEPLGKDAIRENGVDFRLVDEIAHHRRHPDGFVMDPSNEKHTALTYNVEKNRKRLIIYPHEQVLMSTVETIGMPDDLVGFVELRSTWARHGLSLPPTIIDAGFYGTITLEVINNAPYKILLRPGQRFAHIVFIKTNNKVMGSYIGKYQNQSGIKLPQKLKKK